MVAVILCGLQGSGKSSFCRARFYDSHVRINLDMVGTREREAVLLHACLSVRQAFVVDNTNPRREQRERYVKLAKAAGYEVECYYVDTPMEECVARNVVRVGNAQVPEVAIRGTAKKWERPSKAEGFDRVYRVVASGGEFTVEEMV